MNTISSFIVDLLDDDMVDHGFFVQCVGDEKYGGGPLLNWQNVLEELLSGGVEIGTTEIKNANYLEFIAWRGSVSERISRAVECVDKAVASNKAFAYWLCLRKNIDRFEGGERLGDLPGV